MFQFDTSPSWIPKTTQERELGGVGLQWGHIRSIDVYGGMPQNATPSDQGCLLALTRRSYEDQRSAIPASAEKSIATNSPRRNLGNAAPAIMAALSVERARDGKNTGSPSLPASRSKVGRNSRLAATPPLTKIVRTSYLRAALSVFDTRSLTIER